MCSYFANDFGKCPVRLDMLGTSVYDASMSYMGLQIAWNATIAAWKLKSKPRTSAHMCMHVTEIIPGSVQPVLPVRFHLISICSRI